ncbi:hypothetical protein KBC04_03550 [Candidatus Babeliales bacterium]|nr:hypothetical protein [Candidatus Babeliales bacterium]MBP9843873.1 hypothetical protein [Candidatus Babeliales bacterium]
MKKKEFVTMNKIQEFNIYEFVQPMDDRFAGLKELFNPFKVTGIQNLVEWLMDDTKISKGNEFISISKERGVIALYYIYDKMISDEYGMIINNMCDPTNCFDMSVKNFTEIVFEWEKLRVSRPDTILIVIHEDNHVSLETNPKIIQEYQDAGYAFDITKAPKRMEKYICYGKFSSPTGAYLDSTNVQNCHCSISAIIDTIQEKHFPDRPYFFENRYIYFNEKEDIFYFGYYKQSEDGTWSHTESELATYVNAKNSCKITELNFLELEQQWLELEKKEELDFCVLVYQNSEGWICCKDFKDQQSMYDFMRQPFI